MTFLESALSMTVVNLSAVNDTWWYSDIVKKVISQLTFVEKDDYKVYVSVVAYSNENERTDLLHPNRSHSKFRHVNHSCIGSLSASDLTNV